MIISVLPTCSILKKLFWYKFSKCNLKLEGQSWEKPAISAAENEWKGYKKTVSHKGKSIFLTEICNVSIFMTSL